LVEPARADVVAGPSSPSKASPMASPRRVDLVGVAGP
jgi:hypothetical protein